MIRFLWKLIKMDPVTPGPRPDTPMPDTMIDLRTPSFFYNHGGLYGPADPQDCNMPNGPCSNCQERIDEMAAAEALVSLSKSPSCCVDRPGFIEPCPECNSPSSYVTHASKGLKTCNGCKDSLCIRCFFGARYYCPLRKLEPPTTPLLRQEAIGVQSPNAQEKGENK